MPVPTLSCLGNDLLTCYYHACSNIVKWVLCCQGQDEQLCAGVLKTEGTDLNPCVQVKLQLHLCWAEVNLEI